jgi:predicted unusual protein kinase regulating ubiquinone biosynthesis (AarF/ABC1/UbiB family)
MKEVAVILARSGLGRLVRGVPELGPAGEARGPESTTPDLFVDALQQLGPTYVKLGQVLSTRPDILPPAYISALERLQDQVRPVPFSQIKAVIEQELGDRYMALLETLDEEPLATASIAQVHGAVLQGGKQIVLKVQRPGIRPRSRPTCTSSATCSTAHSSSTQRSPPWTPSRCSLSLPAP